MPLEKFLDQVEDGVDPRVQVELERLNNATDDINKLEVDLDEARNQFRQLLQESTYQIDNCAKKLGNCIIKVRPYYDARIKARQALLETQKAAVNFERANSAHAAAKEMVYLAEEGLKTEGRTFDHAWQEMLNHATMRVNESESERTRSEAEHKRTSQIYQFAEIRVRTLQKDLKRAITKSRPYFELKIHYNQLLEKQKVKVKNLEKEVADVKLTYAHTLKNLEKISDEIHKTRQKDKHSGKNGLGKRSEGVGSESDSSSEFRRLYSMGNGNNGSGCAKTINFQSNSNQIPNGGNESETGKNTRIQETSTLSSPVTETYSSIRTLTSNTPISSQPDTDVWSEFSSISNSGGTPNSDSSLTGPPDTESEDEILKLPEKYSVQHFMKKERSKSLVCNLKGSGDYISQPKAIEDFNRQFKIEDKPSKESNGQSVFEGVGICSFPIETELNLNFENDFKEKEDSLQVEITPNSGWTEIKLSSPEDDTFSLVKIVNSGKCKNELEEDFDIPYAPLSEPEGHCENSNESPSEKKAELLVEDLTGKNGLDGMLRGISNRLSKKETGEEESKSLKSTPRKINLRRQSLDVLWNNTAGEKVKEILSQSIMKLNIGSLTERKSGDAKHEEDNELGENEMAENDSRGNEGSYESNLTSQFGMHFFNRKNSKADDDVIQTMDERKNSQESISSQIGGFISRKEKFFTKKVPSPLEKTLNYLNADEESNSDSESLASCDMLTDEQLLSLVLDKDLAELYQDII